MGWKLSPVDVFVSVQTPMLTVLLHAAEFIFVELTVAAFGISFKICSRKGLSGPLAVQVPKYDVESSMLFLEFGFGKLSLVMLLSRAF